MFRVVFTATSGEGAWLTIGAFALLSLLAEFSCVIFDMYNTHANAEKKFLLCTDTNGLSCEPESVPWDEAVGLMTNG